MDLTRQALHTNVKLFQILESFFELVTIFQNNSCVGFMQARWGMHLFWIARILVFLVVSCEFAFFLFCSSLVVKCVSVLQQVVEMCSARSPMGDQVWHNKLAESTLPLHLLKPCILHWQRDVRVFGAQQVTITIKIWSTKFSIARNALLSTRCIHVHTLILE